MITPHPAHTAGFPEVSSYRFTTRTHVQGDVGRVFQAVGLALPPNIAERTG